MKGDSVPFIQKQEGEPVMKSVNGMPYVHIICEVRLYGAIHLMGYIAIVYLAMGIS